MKLTKRDKKLRSRIQSKIEDLLNDPYHNSEELTARFKGKRKVWVGKYRLIYTICKECKKKHYETFNLCTDCEQKQENSVVFWDVSLRKVAYE